MFSQWFRLTILFYISGLAIVHGTYWDNNYYCDIIKYERCTDSQTAKLECPEDKLINVTSATYYAYKQLGWWHRNRYCGCDSEAFVKVKSLCNGKPECEFPCGDDTFNVTTCTGNWWAKLKAKYKCVDNPCDAFCCSNGGTCQLTSDLTPMCVCNGTWNGTHCEDNPCNNVMCQNNGTCLINPADGTAQCVCTKDYTGTTCETEMPCNETQMFENPCDSFMCENNGSCLINPTNNTAQCCCTSDYTGETCETKLDACSTVQCQNGGNCTISTTGQAVCQCPEGFKGTFCQDQCSIPKTCPAGYDELPANSGNCYLICDFDAQSWFAADDFCRRNGSVLWEPNDISEVNAVEPQLIGSETYWTGASDLISENNTVFSGSGQSFTLTSEVSGSNTALKDCLKFERVSVTVGFKFIYRACTSTTSRCICETQTQC